MKAGTMTEASTSPPPASVLKCIAWCPDDCDQSAAREYVGSNTPKEIAEQHAEHVYYEQGTRRCCCTHCTPQAPQTLCAPLRFALS